MRPSRMPTSALHDARSGRAITAFVITRSRAPSARVARDDCPIPSRITLPPPNFASSPGTVQVALDLDEQVGVGETHAVAGGRAVEVA